MLREKFTTLAPPSPYVYLQMVRTNQLAEHIRKGQKVAQPSKRYETRIRSWVTNNYYAGWKRTAWIQEYKNQLRKSIVLTLNTDIPVSISFFNHFLDQLPGIPPVHHGLDITKKLEREAKQGRINNILCDIKDGDHKLEYETILKIKKRFIHIEQIYKATLALTIQWRAFSERLFEGIILISHLI